jgi:hypothetical protein
MITSGPATVSLIHNTVFQTSAPILVDSGSSSGFVVRDNMMKHNTYGVYGSNHASGNDTLQAYFPGAVFVKNVLAGGPASQYPPDNFFPTVSAYMAQFDPNGSYALVPSSPYKGAGDDGNDLGVDTAALYAAQDSAAVPPPAPPPSSTSDVVLYASDMSTIAGNWQLVASPTGASGQKMLSNDYGAPAISSALANPADYFEATFSAAANTPYHVWLRLRATDDSKYNDSVWVQFSDAVDSGGSSVWRIGTDSALLVNLEDCASCGVSAWGWQDHTWWADQNPTVRFTTAGPHTLRVQTREDGVQIDQIVLSASTYLSTAPGPKTNDTTIVPKPSGGSGVPPPPPLPAPATDIVIHASDVQQMSGNFFRSTSDSTAAEGIRMSSTDYGAAAVDTPLVQPADYFEVTFNAVAGVRYHVWFRLKAAADSKWNDSIYAQFSDSQDASGTAIYRLGTSSGLTVNLESCSGCGDSGWGWRDGAWWTGQSADVYFATTGTHRLRVQVREDGVKVDQMVLSPARYLTSAPGSLTDDATILNRDGTVR